MSILRGNSFPVVVAIMAGVLFLLVPGAFADQHGDGTGGPFGTGPVHGPGSSHNPIVAATIVRDHRQPRPRPDPKAYSCGLNWNAPGCNVRDHRTALLPPPILCFGLIC